jgi:hypothetical protein
MHYRPHPLRKFLESLVASDGCWSIMESLGGARLHKLAKLRNRELKRRRYWEVHARIRRKIEEKGLQVHNGPFSGMRYTTFASRGSALLPKLLGTYENELHATLESMPLSEFSTIVDIGCAEGYYAVGLALRCGRAKVFAYDIEERSRDLCRSMAESNNVSDRVTILGECTPQMMTRHDFSQGGLIVSDCEGYERVLFTSETSPHLGKAHILIELHETEGEDLAGQIRTAFSDTHEFRLIPSMTDEEKAKSCTSEFVNMDDLFESRVAFEEMRGKRMNWAVLTPKSQACS